MYEKFAFLLALEREKHFGRAAQVCGVSQPNLSAAIKTLEQQLGLTLVDRGARFMGFTPEGERVLEWARRIVGDFRAMEGEIETMKQGQVGVLKLAVIPTALPVISRLTAAFWARHPGIRFNVSSNTSAEILALLDNLEADCGITYLDAEPIGRNAEMALYQERYCLVTARGARFADRPTVTWEEAASLPLCLPASDTQNRRILDRVFAEIGVVVEPQLESNAAVVLLSHLRSCGLATIMSKIMAEDLGLASEFAIVPLVAPEAPTLVGMIYPRREPMPPLLAGFITEARALVLGRSFST